MNIKLILTYDGTRYRGWQRLPSTENTIQGKLETALSRILSQKVEVIGSGRTDAGAHAVGQVANFHCETTMSVKEILSDLRKYLPEDIGVLSCEEVAPRFHARYNARRKTYLYRVWNYDTPCVFLRDQVYRMTEPLDLAAMRQAAEYFVGTHDFRAFCSNKKFNKSTVRTIDSLNISRQGSEIRFLICADGFLYNMVRIIVGTLLEVGRADRPLLPDEIPAIFQEECRARAGYTVPARGLTLMEVEY